MAWKFSPLKWHISMTFLNSQLQNHILPAPQTAPSNYQFPPAITTQTTRLASKAENTGAHFSLIFHWHYIPALWTSYQWFHKSWAVISCNLNQVQCHPRIECPKTACNWSSLPHAPVAAHTMTVAIRRSAAAYALNNKSATHSLDPHTHGKIL